MIVAAVHDPGGTQVWMPVLQRLQAEGKQVKVLAGNPGGPFLARNGIEFQPMSTSLESDDAARLLEGATQLLTGTSWNSNAEQRLRNEAYRREIPSFVLLDFWSNYRERWNESEYVIERMPDRVGVIDEEAREAMVAVGFPQNQITVIGSPHLEQIESLPSSVIQEDPLRVLFLSQPLSVLGYAGEMMDPYQIVMEALEKWGGHRPVLMGIKPHPKEALDVGLIEKCRQAFGNLSLEWISASQPLDTVMDRFEVVIGFATMGLIEARLCGKRSIALRMNSMKVNDVFERYGVEVVEIEGEAILRGIERSFSLINHRDLNQGATNRAWEWIYS